MHSFTNQTNIGINWCWINIIFHSYHSCTYSEEFTFLNIARVWAFDAIVLSQYHSGLYTIKEPSYLGKIVAI